MVGIPRITSGSNLIKYGSSIYAVGNLICGLTTAPMIAIMRGISKVVATVILVFTVLLILASFKEWYLGLVSNYSRDVSVKLYIAPPIIYSNGTMEIYMRNYGRDVMIDSIMINGKYELLISNVTPLTSKPKPHFYRDDSILYLPSGSIVKVVGKLPSGVKLRPGVVYEVKVHTVQGGIFLMNFQAVLYKLKNLSKQAATNNEVPSEWLFSNYCHRAIIKITSKYDRVKYPIPVRLNLTALGFKEYLDPETLKVVTTDGKQLDYSVIRVANNTYWMVVNTTVLKDKPAYIEVYFNTTDKPAPLTKVYGNLSYAFAVPCGCAYELNNSEVTHLQFASDERPGNYVLLIGEIPLINGQSELIMSKVLEGNKASKRYTNDVLDFNFPFFDVNVSKLRVTAYLRLDTSPWNEPNPTKLIQPYVDQQQFVDHALIAAAWTYEFKDFPVQLSVYSGEINGLKYREYVWKVSGILSQYIHAKIWLIEGGDILIKVEGVFNFAVSGISRGDGINGKWLAYMVNSKFNYPDFFNNTSVVPGLRVKYDEEYGGLQECPEGPELTEALNKYYFLMVNLETINATVVSVT